MYIISVIITICTNVISVIGLALLTALSGADVARQVQNAIHYMA